VTSPPSPSQARWAHLNGTARRHAARERHRYRRTAGLRCSAPPPLADPVPWSCGSSSGAATGAPARRTAAAWPRRRHRRRFEWPWALGRAAATASGGRGRLALAPLPGGQVLLAASPPYLGRRKPWSARGLVTAASLTLLKASPFPLCVVAAASAPAGRPGCVGLPCAAASVAIGTRLGLG